MKKLILAISVTFILAIMTSCTFGGVNLGISSKKTLKGDRNITESETVLTDAEYELVVEDIEFKTVSNNLNEKITISEDAGNKVVLASDKNIVDSITVSVENNTITVKGDKDVKYDCSDFDLRINAKVKGFRIDGGFDFEMDAPSVTKFDGVVNGALNANMAFGKLDSFSLIVNGAGNFVISGEAEKSLIEINGAGNVSAFDLHAVDNRVVLNGAGNCEVYATETLDVEMNGLGAITYDGDPKTVNTGANMLGSIKKR